VRRSWPIAVAAALGLLLLTAASAVAAPPGNDDFANAEEIGPALPVALTESNAEATKEPGEPAHAFLGSKGHSVWFKWEASGSGFVTVGTCGSDFAAVASVYVGTQVDELTKVAGDPASEGPGCPSSGGREVTFKATAGTIYEIAVDGDAFYLPPAEPPQGEGMISLQLDFTPTPANDDFADATALSGSIEEEGTESAFYWASAPGYNWSATKEEGEPDHGGDPGGASVWYSWTAPLSGVARAAVCASAGLLLGVYTGSEVDALAPVASAKGCPNVSFTASAGTVYRLAVDGEFDAVAGEADRASFLVSISMQLPPQPAGQGAEPGPAAPAPPADRTPPETTVARTKIEANKRRVSFVFASSEPGSTFRCRLDKRPFAPCPSPRTYRNLKAGGHRFAVAAVDAAGNVDPSPASVRFRVPNPSRRR
jgi:hypothetical protein